MSALSKIKAQLPHLTEDKLEAMLAVVSLLAATDEEPDAEEEEEEAEVIKRPGKRSAKVVDDDEDEVTAPKKRGPKPKPKTEKTETKKPAAARKSEATDIGDMTEKELIAHAASPMFGPQPLDFKKAKVKGAAAMVAMLTKIEKLAAGGKDYVAIAEKKGVDVTQSRGKADDTKRNRVAIVQMINAGQSPLK